MGRFHRGVSGFRMGSGRCDAILSFAQCPKWPNAGYTRIPYNVSLKLKAGTVPTSISAT